MSAESEGANPRVLSAITTIKQTRLVVYNGSWVAPTPGNDTVEVPKQGRAGPAGAPIHCSLGPDPAGPSSASHSRGAWAKMNWPKGLSFTNRSNR